MNERVTSPARRGSPVLEPRDFEADRGPQRIDARFAAHEGRAPRGVVAPADPEEPGLRRIWIRELALG